MRFLAMARRQGSPVSPQKEEEDVMRRAFAASRVFKRLAVLAATVATVSGTVSARTAYAFEDLAVAIASKFCRMEDASTVNWHSLTKVSKGGRHADDND